MDRLTEKQFENLIALTSVRVGSGTHDALRNHLVLGYTKREAYEKAGITQQAMSAAIARVTDVDELARRYVESVTKQQ